MASDASHRDETTQRIAHEDSLGVIKVDRPQISLRRAPRCQQFLPQHPRKQACGQRGRQQTPVSLHEDVGDRALTEKPITVAEEHFISPIGQLSACPVVKRAPAGLVAQPGICRVEPRLADGDPPAVRTGGQRAGRERKASVAAQRQPDPMGARPIDRRQAVQGVASLKREVERGSTPRHPAEMEVEPRIAEPCREPQGLYQLEPGQVVLREVAKRVFQRASSYSVSAVLSYTIPPPTFSRTVPSPGKTRVRMATLNSMAPAGEIQPIAPQ